MISFFKKKDPRKQFNFQNPHEQSSYNLLCDIEDESLETTNACAQVEHDEEAKEELIDELDKRIGAIINPISTYAGKSKFWEKSILSNINSAKNAKNPKDKFDYIKKARVNLESRAISQARKKSA